VAGDSPPATQEAAPQTAQDWAQWINDGRAAGMSLDQMLTYFTYSDPSYKDFAVALARTTIDTDKLEQAVKTKWGNEAYVQVAHLCMDDTPGDDAQAEWTVGSLHATAVFKIQNVGPLCLVRDNGRWKVDVDSYVAIGGAPVSTDVAFIKDMTDVVDRATQKLSQNDFSSADALCGYLKGEISKAQH
jgi:hypothetical protein